MIYINVKDKILEVSKILDELDTFEENISNSLQHYDYRLSDLYHKLEMMTLDSKKCYRFCKEFKQTLKERRDYKNNLVVFQKYQNNKQKLNNGKTNRELLINQVCQEYKNVNNSVYKNRIYTEEDLKEKIGE